MGVNMKMNWDGLVVSGRIYKGVHGGKYENELGWFSCFRTDLQGGTWG